MTARFVVPTAPVVVPLVLVVALAIGCRLQRGGALTVSRAITTLAVAVYLAGVVGHVLLPFAVAPDRPELPWQVWLHLTPVVDAVDDPIGMVLNTVLFVPLGFLLPLTTRFRTWAAVVLVGLAASLTIEAVQLLASLTISPGRVADVDDLIANTLGTALGLGILRAVGTASWGRSALRSASLHDEC